MLKMIAAFISVLIRKCFSIIDFGISSPFINPKNNQINERDYSFEQFDRSTFDASENDDHFAYSLYDDFKDDSFIEDSFYTEQDIIHSDF